MAKRWGGVGCTLCRLVLPQGWYRPARMCAQQTANLRSYEDSTGKGDGCWILCCSVHCLPGCLPASLAQLPTNMLTLWHIPVVCPSFFSSNFGVVKLGGKSSIWNPHVWQLLGDGSPVSVCFGRYPCSSTGVCAAPQGLASLCYALKDCDSCYQNKCVQGREQQRAVRERHAWW